MKIVLFYHSLLSDWNNGHAHFLRGLAAELLRLNHEVTVFEPAGGWSLRNLLAEAGRAPVREFRRLYPRLRSRAYSLPGLDPDRVLDGAGLVIVHEWNEPRLARRLGRHRRSHGGYRLLFHDSHHRAVSRPDHIRAFGLEDFDGVLAYGEAIREIYLRNGWSRRAWTWHEAADVRIFRPLPGDRDGDVVWIGNWGDGERTREYAAFLLNPVRRLRLRAEAYGVRYPAEGLRRLAEAGIVYGGWLANFRVPEVYARFKVALHIPRRIYAHRLPGIPTIRPFEALACGMPLVCSPWTDTEGLFESGADYLVARTGGEMQRRLRDLVQDPGLREALGTHGRRTILARHTCAHRARQLLEICREIGAAGAGAEVPAPPPLLMGPDGDTLRIGKAA